MKYRIQGWYGDEGWLSAYFVSTDEDATFETLDEANEAVGELKAMEDFREASFRVIEVDSINADTPISPDVVWETDDE